MRPGRSAKKTGGGRSSGRAAMALAVMGAIVLVYGWNSMVLAPRARARASVTEELTAARKVEQDLRHNMAELRKLATDTQSREAELAHLGRLVPADADVAGAIVALDETAKAAQVGMASLVPSPPAATAGGGPAAVGVSMTISGTFDQLYDYLLRLETLDRLVVVDRLELSGGGGAAAPAGGVSPGSPKLTAEIKARMFAAGGAPPAPGAPAAAVAAASDPSATAALPKAGG